MHALGWFERLDLTDARETTLGALISIDPNCRPSMTENRDEYLQGMIRFFKAADIVKLSDEDLNYLHPEWSEDAALETFIEEYAPQLCVYTEGSDGPSRFNPPWGLVRLRSRGIARSPG